MPRPSRRPGKSRRPCSRRPDGPGVIAASDAGTTRYLHLRQVARGLNDRLLAGLSPAVMDRAMERLNMLNPDGPGVAADSEYDLFVLYDYALYDMRNSDGNNAIDDFAEWNADTLTTDERLVLAGARAARFGVFMVRDAHPGRGVELEPFDNGMPNFFLHDVALGSSTARGVILAGRVMTIDGLPMTTGAAIPVLVEEAAADLLAFLTEWELSPGPHDPAEFSAEVINLLLDNQATLFMYSVTPRQPRSRKPEPPAAPTEPPPQA